MSSCVKYYDKYFWAKDLTLMAWMIFIVWEIDHLESQPNWLRQLRDEWYIQATERPNGTGTVDPNLDEYLTSSCRCQLLIKIAQHSLRTLENQGDTLTKEWLNNMYDDVNGYRFDVPRKNFDPIYIDFIELLRHGLKYKPS